MITKESDITEAIDKALDRFVNFRDATFDVINAVEIASITSLLINDLAEEVFNALIDAHYASNLEAREREV